MNIFLRRFSKILAFVGGLGFAWAILVTCASALGKMGARLVNTAFGADGVPVYLDWIKPVRGEDEIVAFAVGFALFSTLPWVMITRGHIRIDLFERFFAPWVNRALNLVGDIALTLLAWLIFAQQWNLIFKKARRNKEPLLDVLLAQDWPEAAKRFLMNKETQVLGLDFWPLYLWAEFCVLAFFLVGLFCVWQSARAVFLGSAEQGGAA